LRTDWKARLGTRFDIQESVVGSAAEAWKSAYGWRKADQDAGVIKVIQGRRCFVVGLGDAAAFAALEAL
jgi:hypothetical protein